MRTQVSQLLWICLFAVLASAGAAAADETDDVSAARLHYKKGTRAFELGHYAEAIKEYEAAYQAKDDPALLYNLGQAYRLNGDYPSAIREYKAYLHRIPEAPNADEVRSRIDEMQSTLDEKRRTELANPPATIQKPPTPNTAVVPPATQSQTPTASPPAPAERSTATPLVRKWWLWTIVGVVVVGGAAAATAIVLTSSKSDGFTPTIPDVGPGPHTTSLTVRF